MRALLHRALLALCLVSFGVGQAHADDVFGLKAKSIAQQALNATGVIPAAIRAQVQQGDLEEAIKSGRARFALYSSLNYPTSVGTITAGATNSTGLGFYVRPGWRFYLTNLSMCLDGEGNVQFRLDPDAAQNWYASVSNKAASNQLPFYNAANGVVGSSGGCAAYNWQAGIPLGENGTGTMFYVSYGTTARRSTYAASGYEVPDTQHADAAVRVNIFGDSLSAGGNLGNDANGLAYLGYWNWWAKLETLARTAGKDVGIFANYAEDGRTCEEMAYNLQTGKYAAYADRWVVMCGTNDAASAKYTSTAQTQAAIQAFVDYRDRNYPGQGVKILFCGPPNTDDPDRTGGTPSRITSVRSAISTKVAALLAGGEKDIAFCDPSIAIPLGATQATDTNYKSQERVAGQTRVHLSGIGSTTFGQYVFDNYKTFLFGL